MTMRKVKKIGYLSVPISYGIDQLSELMSEFKQFNQVGILLTKVVATSKKYVKFAMYSNKRSWAQDYTTDGLSSTTIVDGFRNGKFLKNWID